MTGPATDVAADVLTVAEPEARRLAELAGQFTAGPHADPVRFCRTAAELCADVPPRLATAIRSFRRESRTGVLIFAGLPTGTVPATPADNRHHVGEGCTLSRIQAILAELLGHLIAYQAEGEGRLFQDIVPSPPASRTQTSLSSAVELELHTEQAFSALRPDYLSLACLRDDPEARTYLLTARKVVAGLGPAETAALRQPRWLARVDESFRGTHSRFLDGDVRGPMPILSGPENDPRIVLDHDLMSGTDAAAQRLLERVFKIYLQARRSHTLAAGEILFLDNQRVAHGRSVFRPRFDGTDRFIVRAFVTQDLQRSRHARKGDSRMVAGRYS
jgi:L-asparagine oxygenase